MMIWSRSYCFFKEYDSSDPGHSVSIMYIYLPSYRPIISGSMLSASLLRDKIALSFRATKPVIGQFPLIVASHWLKTSTVSTLVSAGSKQKLSHIDNNKVLFCPRRLARDKSSESS